MKLAAVARFAVAHFAVAVAVATVALAAGCASAPAPEVAQDAATASAGGVAYPTGVIETGTRIVRPSTDRAVRVIGNQDVKDGRNDITSIGNNPNIGARGN